MLNIALATVDMPRETPPSLGRRPTLLGGATKYAAHKEASRLVCCKQSDHVRRKQRARAASRRRAPASIAPTACAPTPTAPGQPVTSQYFRSAGKIAGSRVKRPLSQPPPPPRTVSLELTLSYIQGPSGIDPSYAGGGFDSVTVMSPILACKERVHISWWGGVQ